MQFKELSVSGAHKVSLEKRGDERGFFARAFCEKEMGAHGLPTRFVQHNMAHNAHKGTLRGLHYQAAPHGEAKLVRCVRGRLFDFMVDLRPESETYQQWCGIELTAENRDALLIPVGCAHGYLTLEDDTEVLYMSSADYVPESERGVRWNDPAFGIELPIAPKTVSQKDANWPDYKA
ncbi:dTDP-4-dehydrorhamnose 3,5-epimerase [Hirschia litorea]|uniref:dTDP-4-dehydrorhamnose 3,5-epimerase n=1 Tax=Hirschia litorea TaxID=1199156 RepID=A0ABW2IGD3_9PROT